MGWRRSVSWIVGMASILIALLIMASSIASYVSLQSSLASKSGEELSLASVLVVGGGDSGGLITVTAKIVQAEPHVEVPIPNAAVLIAGIIGQNGQGNTGITGFTSDRGEVTFKVPPGQYVVGTSYLGMAGNTTVTVASEESWVLVDWNFFRAIPKDFTIQLHDWDETGVIIPGHPIFAHLSVGEVQKPLVAELFSHPSRRIAPSNILSPKNRIAVLGVVESEHNGKSMWLTLTPVGDLSLIEINPPTDLSIAVYWPRAEVFQLT